MQCSHSALSDGFLSVAFGELSCVRSRKFTEYVTNLSINKVSDRYGVTSERVKHVFNNNSESFTIQFNLNTENESYIRCLRRMYSYTCSKKEKDENDPFSYRRITILPLHGNTIEKIILQHIEISTKIVTNDDSQKHFHTCCFY